MSLMSTVAATIARHIATAADHATKDFAAVAAATSVDGALSAVYQAAETEVAAAQWATVKMLVDGGRTPVDALRLVVEETTRQIVDQGADDNWSGRRNDLRRVRFDALRRWVQTASYMLPQGA